MARNDAAAARQDVAEAEREGRNAVAEEQAETDAARTEAYRPNFDKVAEEQRETEQTRQEAQENVQQQREEAAEAEKRANELEDELAMKQSRDAFVEQVDQRKVK